MVSSSSGSADTIIYGSCPFYGLGTFEYYQYPLPFIRFTMRNFGLGLGVDFGVKY